MIILMRCDGVVNLQVKITVGTNGGVLSVLIIIGSNGGFVGKISVETTSFTDFGFVSDT